MSTRPGTRDVLAAFAGAATTAHDDNQARRDRVLAHPDLVKRLREPPLALKNPERWNGYIPPRADPEQVCSGWCGTHHESCNASQHRSRINDSDVRTQLVDIAAEALRRDTQPALDEIDQHAIEA